MAQKYIVKPTDNALTLAQKYGTTPSRILEANGIKSLTPGQSLIIPKPYLDASSQGYSKFQPMLGLEKPFEQFPTSAIGATGNNRLNPTVTPNLGYQRPQDGTQSTNVPVVNPYQTVMQNPYQPAKPQGTGSFTNNAGAVNTQQGLVNLLAGAVPVQPGGGTVPRPAGVYTGGQGENDAAWRDYWNDQARNPPPASNAFPGFGGGHGRIFSSLREANNAARRRRNANAAADNAQSVIAPPAPSGNSVNSSLSWRVG